MKNFFHAIGMADREKMHSAMIAWILGPNCEALSAIDKSTLLCRLFNVEYTPFDSIQTVIETNDIDIFITTKNEEGDEAHWIIENKIKTNQHSNQLDKYVDKIDKLYGSSNNYFCFLTLTGEEPQGGKKDRWVRKTYGELISIIEANNSWLNRGNSHCQFLQEYIESIKELDNALRDFIEHPDNYPHVFQYGRTAKNKKDFDSIKNDGKYATFIAEYNLENTFKEKLFLDKIKNKINVADTNEKILVKSMGDTMLLYYKTQWIFEDLRIQIELQGNAIKIVLLHKLYDEPQKDTYKIIYNPLIGQRKSFADIFNNHANKEWRVEKSKKYDDKPLKPRIALVKSIKKEWYKNIDDVKNELLDGFKNAFPLTEKIAKKINEMKNARNT